MASLLFRLGSFSARQWKPVVIVWMVLLLAFAGSAFAFKSAFSGGFTLPATQASRVLDQLDNNLTATNSGPTHETPGSGTR